MDTIALMHKEEGAKTIPRLPVDSETTTFNNWTISYTKSHILKSICTRNNECKQEKPEECCELCTYNFAVNLPHLPDMVFHKNELTLVHENGARLEFKPLHALQGVKLTPKEEVVKVACSEEWKESRPADTTTEKVKPFDWTFCTEYQGTCSGMKIEPTEKKIDLMKLMKRENILFYHDLTLFEDELHDHGISSCSVKIRVMPSGFYVLLRNFIRVDGVLIKINDTRFHYEVENNYIVKEFTVRGAKIPDLKHIPPVLFTDPQEISQVLPIERKVNEILIFK
uniref:TIP41-like protein n=1 Tax=Culicoides sonorensis TaxID=179676 RepID=A0A336MVD6_CULSO